MVKYNESATSYPLHYPTPYPNPYPYPNLYPTLALNLTINVTLILFLTLTLTLLVAEDNKIRCIYGVGLRAMNILERHLHALFAVVFQGVIIVYRCIVSSIHFRRLNIGNGRVYRRITLLRPSLIRPFAS